MKLIKLSILLILSLTACTSAKNTTNSSNAEIRKLQSYVSFLASDSLKGRFPGTPESVIAAKYIRDKLQSFGYTPLANNGLQTFQISSSQRLGEENSFAINGKEYQLGKDFMPLSISSSEQLSAKVCFVGYGLSINQERLKKDDYQNIAIEGRWALMLFGGPNNKYDRYSSYQSKAAVARDKGAKGVIFVAGQTTAKNNELMPFALREASVGIPCIQVSREIVDEFMHKENRDLAIVEKNLSNDLNTINYEAGYIITANTSIESIRVNTHNITMKLEGSDPSLKNESIVIGAHYDHLGFGGRGSGSMHPSEHAIHNGADDNASGVALVMLLAEKLAKKKEQLRRSVIIVLFGAEEQGFIGSKYFVSNPPNEVGKMVAMLNFDMVGRLNSERKIQIAGIGTFEQGEEIVKSAVNPDSLKLSLSKGGFGPSDHTSFYAKQIPVLYFTTGLHGDYHTPYDTADKLEYKGIRSIELLAEDIVKQLSSLSTTPVFKDAEDSDISNYLHSKLTVTLGIIPDFSSNGSDGIHAAIISEGKPAHKAGMKAGDIIISIGSNRVYNIRDYMQSLSELKSGETVEVVVIRNNTNITLQVHL